jgi:hypothetical protein
MGEVAANHRTLEGATLSIHLKLRLLNNLWQSGPGDFIETEEIGGELSAPHQLGGTRLYNLARCALKLLNAIGAQAVLGLSHDSKRKDLEAKEHDRLSNRSRQCSHAGIKGRRFKHGGAAL